MGATNIEFELDGNASSEQVRQSFKRQQETDRQNNGNRDGYSGDFQTVHQVDVHHEKLFDSYDQAQNYCLDNAKKWETVVAVRYKIVGKVKADSKANKLQASRIRLQVKLKQLNDKYFLTLETKLKSTEFVTDKQGCKSRLATKYLLQMDVIRCPVCQGSLLSAADQKRRNSLKEKLKQVETEIREHEENLQKQAAAKSTETQWLVCGWGAC